jgi:hypothetical protein
MASKKKTKTIPSEIIENLKTTMHNIKAEANHLVSDCNQESDKSTDMTQQNTNELVQGLATFVAALLVFISGIISVFYCPFTFGLITLVTMVTCSLLMIKSNKKLMDTIKINIKVQ